jgi:DNA replication and repair protein RecF
VIPVLKKVKATCKSIVYLKKLELKNYRNYGDVSLNLDKNTILILGNNGNGKTHLLESI